MEDTPQRAIRLTDEELKSLVKSTVHETMITLGINASDPIEMQKDFQHLRDWRMTTNAVKRHGLKTIIATLIAGICALVWLAVTGDKP